MLKLCILIITLILCDPSIIIYGRIISSKSENKNKLEVEITGNNIFSSDEIIKVMKLNIIGHNINYLDESINRLRMFLGSKGFIKPEIGSPQIIGNNKIRIFVNEGVKYRIGKINVINNEVLLSKYILEIAEINSGEIANSRKLNKAIDNIRNKYGELGHLQATIVINEDYAYNQERDEGIVNWIFDIDEGNKFFIKSIEFAGDSNLYEDLLKETLLLKEGDLCNTKLMNQTMEKINSLGIFKQLREEDINYLGGGETHRVRIVINIKKAANTNK